MQRIALLSDTHGVLDPRIADIVSQCDLAVHGGDIGNAGVLAQLGPRSGRIAAVLGNNDVPSKWPEGEQHLLTRLPLEVIEDLPGGRLVVVHGHRTPAKDRHARLRRRFPQARAIVYGHSHRLVADCDTEPWVLNPGAAGRARTFGGPSCMVLLTSPAEWLLEVHRFPPAAGGTGRRPRRQANQGSS
jgi:putative phosphoesterase